MNDQTKDLELYIHIPFCVRKCKYCDFLSAPATKQVQSAYMEALLKEVRGRAEEMYQVSSIFIGGGTPSLVDPVWIERLLDAARANYAVRPDAEITIEMNPGTVTRESLAVYKKAGVNRLSIGLQSADNTELKRLGRVHDYGQFLDSYRWAREAGFSNINVDLMSAIPGQTPESWMSTVYTILGLQPVPEHISAYSLIVEEGTPFAELQEKGELTLPDEDTERAMYWEAARLLKDSGYEHYEISNYAKPGFACRHNCGYWQRTDYLGLGIGAASLINNRRFQNADSLDRYLKDPLGCLVDRQELSLAEQMEETMFLGLRMAAGVDLEAFRKRFDTDPEQLYREAIRKNLDRGLLQYQKKHLCLTPKGVDLSNVVMADFLLDISCF